MLQALEVFTTSRGVGPAAVMCSDGAMRSGLFLAAHLLTERLSRDRFLDLFHTLKALKMRRLSAVTSVVSYSSFISFHPSFLPSKIFGIIRQGR